MKIEQKGIVYEAFYLDFCLLENFFRYVVNILVFFFLLRLFHTTVWHLAIFPLYISFRNLLIKIKKRDCKLK